MKYLLSLLFTICITIQAYSQGADSSTYKEDLSNVHITNTITGYGLDFHEMDFAEQLFILKYCDELIAILKANDPEALRKQAHSTVKEKMSYDNFKSSADWIAQQFEGAGKATFVDAKKAAYDKAPNKKTFMVGGNFDVNDSLYLSYQVLPGAKMQCIAIYQFDNHPKGKTLELKLGREGQKYKLMDIHFITRTVCGKDADYYKQLADKWKSEVDQFPRFMALNMAFKLASLGPGTRNRQLIRLDIERNDLRMRNKNLELYLQKWKVGKKNYHIKNLNFIETEDDVVLHVDYVTRKKITAQQVEEETGMLFEYMQRKHPVLFQEFNKVVFTASKKKIKEQSNKAQSLRVIHSL